MAYFLLNIIMLYYKEKKNTQYQNIYYNNIDKEKEEDDFFSSFKNINNLQELWLKAIFFKKTTVYCHNFKGFQKLNSKSFFYFYKNNTLLKNIKKSQMKFLITNKFGDVIGSISLIYLHKYQCIYIKDVGSIKGKLLEVIENKIIKLLDYFRNILHKKLLISLAKNDAKKISFFKKIGFKNIIRIPLMKNLLILIILGRISQKNWKNIILTAGPSVSLLETTKTFDAAKNGWNQNWNKYMMI